ncbi:epithelial membrane protein 1-like [Haliotis cracherodii]|uniref:epithelial membrane protein 1-like n=1 Tax=Haliotis cracherodii TaxID=6455 RepID=UPI0039E8CC9B
MGLKDSFMKSPTLTKVCLILLLLAQICSWIAFTVPEWGRTYTDPLLGTDGGYTGLGLWRRCSNGASTSYTGPSNCITLDGAVLDWFVAVQAFSIFGFVGINIAFIIVMLQVFTSKCDDVTDIGFWNAVQSIVTAICYLIAVIVFGAEFNDGDYGRPIPKGVNYKAGELAFSFGLAIVALLLEGVAGVLMLVDNKKGKGTSPA